MMQPGDGSCLTLEPGARFRLFRDVVQKHLHGDGAIEPWIMGLIDFSHTARTYPFDDLVMT
jgi:hypothetical protein